MIKRMLVVLGLMLALVAVKPATAQWHDNDSCNRSQSNGFNRYAANGPFKVRYYIQFHYTPSNLEGVKHEIVEAFTGEMNAAAIREGSDLRFEGVDWNTSEDQGLNFTVFLDAYSTADGYSVYADVHGWSAGHLFRVSARNQVDPGTAVGDVADEVTARMVHGWTCSN